MSSRTRSYRPWLWSAAVLVLSAGPVAAQPPSPVELVRGLRENGQFDLALEYLKEIESQVTTPDDKAAIGLERAKCLLEAAEEESEESTRVGMISLAKEGLNTFLTAAPNHPRRVEGLLAQAKLTALDAREQLNKARRIDIPPASEDKEEIKAREAAQERQKEEAKKARPLFLLASRRYAEASELLRVRLSDAALDANTRRALQQEAFDAELASGINQFNTAETFMPVSRVTTAEKEERNKYLEAAKETFGKLDKGPANNRAVWTARAWIAEVTYEQNDFNVAAQQVAAILKANMIEAEDGKRLARFFALRRNFIDALSERVLPKVLASEKEIRDWLKLYGRPRKPTNEVYAVRFYLARLLQTLAESSLATPKPKDGKEPKTPPPPPTIGAQARTQFTEAERIYRDLTQAEHDYTGRASRYRMQVVRRLIGEADQPLSAYDTFERAQMASLIQLGKLAQEEAKDDPDPEKVKRARLAAIALLERARDLAGPNDSAADVTAALLLLIYTYQVADQPYQAATLGDYTARTLKNTGGKAAVAGLLGLNGYYAASKRLRIDASMTDEEITARTAARGVDRARAIALAKFLDEKYPNDNATDAARYRLASLMTEDQRYPEAFEAVIKVRPAYAQIANVRLLEGYLAAEIVKAKDTPPEKKVEVFRRAVTDLAKAVKPVNVALEEEVRTYVSARCRLATLLFIQGRVDPEREKANPGYNQALEIGNEVLAIIPTFDHMVTTQGGAKKLNLDGMEMTMLALDVRAARRLYLRARALIDASQLDEAAKSIDPAIAEINTSGPAVTAEMKAWGSDGNETDAVQKSRVRKLAEGVDKTRVEVLLAGFRLRVRQGKAKEGEDLLNQMVKIGGSLEENLPLLEALGRESAAKMLNFQKEGKTKEAAEIGAGLAVLLKKITEVPKLSPTQLLFVGQMLVPVKEYDKAIETLRKVPEPEYKEWRTTDPTRLQKDLAEAQKKLAALDDPAVKAKSKDDPAALQKEIAELQKKIEALAMGIAERHPSQMHAYSVAQLTIGKALREAKRYSEAEKHLQEIIGPPEKPGWGSGRLYFRKELAAVYEDRGASVTGTSPADVKAANGEWGKALQIWTTLWGIHRNRLQKLPPAEPMPDATAAEDVKQAWADKEKRRKEEERQAKNSFADAYFEIQRCLIKANQQLLKDQPPKLQKTMDDVAKRFFDIETKVLSQPQAWDAEVQHRYVDLIKETPALLAAYKAAGGKFFLEKKAADE